LPIERSQFLRRQVSGFVYLDTLSVGALAAEDLLFWPRASEQFPIPLTHPDSGAGQTGVRIALGSVQAVAGRGRAE